MTNKIDQRVEELFGEDLIRSKKFENKIKKALTQTHKEALQKALELVGKDEWHFPGNNNPADDVKEIARDNLRAELREALQAEIESV